MEQRKIQNSLFVFVCLGLDGCAQNAGNHFASFSGEGYTSRGTKGVTREQWPPSDQLCCWKKSQVDENVIPSVPHCRNEYGSRHRTACCLFMTGLLDTVQIMSKHCAQPRHFHFSDLAAFFVRFSFRRSGGHVLPAIYMLLSPGDQIEVKVQATRLLVAEQDFPAETVSLTPHATVTLKRIKEEHTPHVMMFQLNSTNKTLKVPFSACAADSGRKAAF